MGLLQNGFTDDSENLTLGVARNIGIDLGAHFIGVHGGNCDDRVEAQVLTGAAARMP